jgi:PAS domain S-box-containing protein
VFERFHRIESTRARTYEGTGIGLALVQELVKLHGGTVGVHSELGRGSTFTVCIPRGTAHLPSDRIQATRTVASTALSAEAYVDEAERWLPPTTAGVPEQPSSSQEPSAKSADLVVIADDNADMRDYLVHLLRERYQVHAVADGEQAVEVTRRLHPSLVIADVMMPGLDGFGVLRAIRNDANVNSTPVILLSARAGEESRVEGIEAGADDYLVKPFTARELLARVATHIQMSKVRREAADRESRLRAEADRERLRLQELLQQAPAAIGLMTGPDHRWTYVNDTYIRVTGRSSPADFLGKTIRESLPEVEGQGFFELLDQVYRTGRPFVGRDMKARLNRSATGQPEEAYFNFVYQPILDGDGHTEGILVHAVEETEQVLTRRAIEDSQERLRLAQKAAQIGVWEWDPVQNTSTLSPELHRIFGTDPSDPEHAHKWASRVHPDDWQRVQQEMYEGHRSGAMDFEYRYQHPADGLRWFTCTGRRAAGETRMLGVVQDVTDRKRAEEAVRQSETRFRDFVESASVAIHWVGGDGTILWANQAELDLLGYTREEYVGRHIAEFHADAPVIEDILCRLSNGEKLHEYEARLRTKDGSIRHVLIDSSVLFEDGKFIHTRCFTRDITRRKEALVAQARLAAIVESSDDAIVSKDLRGIVTSWNPAAERIFGYTADEMIGRSILKIIPPELQNDEARILDTIARGDRIDHFETVRRTKSGERIEVSLTISPVRDETGKIVGAAKIARDITQRKRAENALRVTERLAAVGRLAATIAHEINNPLEAVTNLIFLARERAANDEVREFLAAAEDELDRVSHLTKQTLGFYRETRGASAIQVGSLVHPLIAVFSTRTRNKAIDVQPEIRQDPEIHAVPGEIRQLIANLLSNSIDAVESGGRIRIRVSAASDWTNGHTPGVRLTVADTGPGIPRDLREKLFEPFFTTKKDVGTGLGLWVCKSIVEKHHGRIQVKSSTRPGKSWTVFSVFLPLNAHEEKLATAV